MPRSYKQRVRGIMGRERHPWHSRWKFTYKERPPKLGKVVRETLDNSDLEMCPNSNRIQVKDGAILLYVGEFTTVVKVELYLPPCVTKVIIHRYGENTTFCGSTDRGNTVKKEIKDPFIPPRARGRRV